VGPGTIGSKQGSLYIRQYKKKYYYYYWFYLLSVTGLIWSMQTIAN